jgi:hypothetical protein
MANWILPHIRKIIHQGYRGWFNVCKSINVIQHINRSKVKKTLDHLNRCLKSLW